MFIFEDENDLLEALLGCEVDVGDTVLLDDKVFIITGLEAEGEDALRMHLAPRMKAPLRFVNMFHAAHAVETGSVQPGELLRISGISYYVTKDRYLERIRVCKEPFSSGEGVNPFSILWMRILRWALILLFLFYALFFLCTHQAHAAKILGIPRGANVQLSDHFLSSEFDCHSDECPMTKINMELVEKLEELRSLAVSILQRDVPIIINSGYRCESYNDKVGGVPGSQHLEGNAADIRLVGVDPGTVAAWAHLIGFHFVLRYDTFVHVDMR